MMSGQKEIITKGTIATLADSLGMCEVKVLQVNRPMNTASVQFRDLDTSPTEQNTYTVLLSNLRERDG